MEYFEFKKYPQDFIVEEKLWEMPSWQGHVFYVFFEKKNKNTFDILKFLWKSFNLKRKHFWIAWLKDKFWITRQWISIYKRTLKSRGWPDKFLKVLSKEVKILKVSWGEKLLKVWDNKWNLFFLRLRLTKKAKEIKFNLFKSAVEKALDSIKTKGFPNYFGIQRFWKKLTNPKIWKKLILWEKKIKDPLEAQFKVQAYASWLFNKYIDLRILKWLFDKFIDGDILTPVLNKKNPTFKLYFKKFNTGVEQYVPTWPLYWYNLVISGDFKEKDGVIIKFTEVTEALRLELEVLKQEWLTINVLSVFKNFNVYWLRRAIKVYPTDLRYKWSKENDLLIMFELPAWSYASVLVEYLDKLVWHNLKV